MWREVLRIINEGTVEGLTQAAASPKHDAMFYENLRHSNEVFAAFKVHAMGVEMAAKLFDANGNLKPFDKWLRDVSAISSHQVGSWLRTEYDTAVIRAHAAADWREFERNKDIMPNLRWMPTTSPQPESSHRQYWQSGLTLPINDPFWNTNHPGNRWNCKCSIEATDSPIVRLVGMEPTPPQRGLENNPGKDGHTFSDNHPYFPDKCSHCFIKKGDFKNRLIGIFTNANKKKDCYNCPYIDGCVEGMSKVNKKAIEHIKELKTDIDQFNGKVIYDNSFLTGSIRVLRRSIQDVFEHAKEDINVTKWLMNIKTGDLKGWKYKGWAQNRPYSPNNPSYDPLHPDKKKHNETKFFTYYSLNINGNTYWANVKMHKDYNGEVLYTIEKNKPDDIIPGKPK